MRTRSLLTLPSIQSAAAWSHPYPAGVFSPVWYADGGDGDGDSGTTDDTGSDGDGGSDKDAGADKSKPAEPDWKAEAEKYKALSRKHETRAKENAAAAKERDELKRQHMSDQERAVDEASAKARAEERVRLAGKLARQGFLAAAAGRLENAAGVADDLNLAKYVGEDGDVDEKGLAELVDRLAPKKDPAKESDTDDSSAGEGKQRAGGGRGFDQGPRGNGSAKEASVAAGRELYAQRRKPASIT